MGNAARLRDLQFTAQHLSRRRGTQFGPGRLGERVDLVSTIGFVTDAMGKKGGQFYTPASVVRVLVEVLAPHRGRVYDLCCGSGGMFVQSEKFIEAHGGKADDRAGRWPRRCQLEPNSSPRIARMS